MDSQIFFIIQIVLSVLLIGLVLLQAKGTGLGSSFGQSISFYSTRRGVEKLLFKLTIVVASLFLISALAAIIL